jgi:hypothetical protein
MIISLSKTEAGRNLRAHGDQRPTTESSKVSFSSICRSSYLFRQLIENLL